MRYSLMTALVTGWLALAGGLITAAAQTADGAPPTFARPQARVETQPVPNPRDAADDPAVWIHPQDPALSLVLGTDKRGGVYVYNLDGSEQQLVADSSLPNNVDVLYDFSLGGRRVDLAVAGVEASANGGGPGVKIWVIDPATRRLRDVTAGGIIAVFGGDDPSGTCGYHSARTDNVFVFLTAKPGQVEQYQLKDAGNGTIGATKVRTLKVGSVAEGCVADDALGFFYLAEESVGIWKFGAEPDAGAEGRLIARVGEHDLTADVEGLTIYSAAQGRGYLIASSQGSDTFIVYDRAGDNHYVLTIDPEAGTIDDVSHTDGIAVSNCPTSRQFARGVFIVQDGKNPGANQNFKLFAWEDIAGQNLVVDTACHARASAP